MATVDIPDRICSHCGGTKWYTVKVKVNGKTYSSYKCVVRRSEKTKRYYYKHIDVIKEKNKEKLRKGYNRTDKMRALYKKYGRIASAELSDNFIKKRLVQDINYKFEGLKFHNKDIPQELIDLKRKQLTLKRKINYDSKAT